MNKTSIADTACFRHFIQFDLSRLVMIGLHIFGNVCEDRGFFFQKAYFRFLESLCKCIGPLNGSFAYTCGGGQISPFPLVMYKMRLLYENLKIFL